MKFKNAINRIKAFEIFTHLGLIKVRPNVKLNLDHHIQFTLKADHIVITCQYEGEGFLEATKEISYDQIKRYMEQFCKEMAV